MATIDENWSKIMLESLYLCNKSKLVNYYRWYFGVIFALFLDWVLTSVDLLIGFKFFKIIKEVCISNKPQQ